jgi:hypothetical protein
VHKRSPKENLQHSHGYCAIFRQRLSRSFLDECLAQVAMYVK